MATRWYSIDANLQTVDHAQLDLNQAYEVIERYFTRYRDHYEWGEEALEASVFGFIQDDGAYMEIFVISRDAIDVTYDLSPPTNALSRLIRRNRDLNERLLSRGQVRMRTKQFFTESRDAFRELVRSGTPGAEG